MAQQSKTISLQDEISELERELKMRRRVYPNWSKGPNAKLTPEQAAHRIACLEATLERLKGQTPPVNQQTSLF